MRSYYFKRIWNPGIFQGHGKRSRYFEGWYFKLVDKNRDRVFAVIPGVSITGDKSKDHCFIQLLEGKSGEAQFFKYDLKDFHYSMDGFQIKIGNSTFSDKSIHLDLNEGGRIIKGGIEFGPVKPWPVRLTSPGCMGWFGFLPGMECYHGVLSFNHSLMGNLQYKEESIDFSEGRGYIEKDWGTSFPSSWVWLQSNHFTREGTSIMVSVADIPWGRSSFMGFLGGLLVDDTLYRFATYTGAVIDFIKVDEGSINLILSDKRHVLELTAKSSKTGTLQSPIKGDMTGSVKESLSAVTSIKLYKRGAAGSRILYEDLGVNGGMEISQWKA